MVNFDVLEGQWKQIAGKAREQWGNLTDDELAKVEGRAERLAGLIQEKYGTSREEADRSVRAFFEKYK
jgi:uncharacterized protein YjbJ (UPF0337 family)